MFFYFLHQNALTWEKINAARSEPVKFTTPTAEEVQINKAFLEDLPDDLSSSRGQLITEVFSNSDVGESWKPMEFSNMPSDQFLPTPMLNFNIPFQSSVDPTLSNFMSASKPETFSHAEQVSTSCGRC
jgi:hypothetical protein